jgi:hypothetical protein
MKVAAHCSTRLHDGPSVEDTQAREVTQDDVARLPVSRDSTNRPATQSQPVLSNNNNGCFMVDEEPNNRANSRHKVNDDVQGLTFSIDSDGDY